MRAQTGCDGLSWLLPPALSVREIELSDRTLMLLTAMSSFFHARVALRSIHNLHRKLMTLNKTTTPHGLRVHVGQPVVDPPFSTCWGSIYDELGTSLNLRSASAHVLLIKE